VLGMSGRASSSRGRSGIQRLARRSVRACPSCEEFRALRRCKRHVHLQQHHRSACILIPSQVFDVLNQSQCGLFVRIAHRTRQLHFEPSNRFVECDATPKITIEDRFQTADLCGGQAKGPLNRRVSPPSGWRGRCRLRIENRRPKHQAERRRNRAVHVTGIHRRSGVHPACASPRRLSPGLRIYVTGNLLAGNGSDIARRSSASPGHSISRAATMELTNRRTGNL
jgi:hypothetical protein